MKFQFWTGSMGNKPNIYKKALIHSKSKLVKSVKIKSWKFRDFYLKFKSWKKNNFWLDFSIFSEKQNVWIAQFCKKNLKKPMS